MLEKFEKVIELLNEIASYYNKKENQATIFEQMQINSIKALLHYIDKLAS